MCLKCPETTYDSKSDLLATFGQKIRQLVDQQGVGTFGVEDAIFLLDDEVEEEVDGANESEL
jgi:hypothetical protein